MGSIIFAPQTLTDSLSETAGYKSGLALSVAEMCDHLTGTDFPDILLASEEHGARLRPEDYAGLFYKLLHRIGYTSEEYDGDYTGAKLYHKYKNTAPEEWAGVTDLFLEIWPKLLEETQATGSNKIDPWPFVNAAYDKYGEVGSDMAMERLNAIDRGLHLNPHAGHRYTQWNSQVALKSLFAGSNASPEVGRFIDQRYINYLSVNSARLSDMHWRKFEELTGEFFHHQGFQVEMGPGTNDDGVDVRVWRPEQPMEESPHIVIQCKRQKAKVEKVVVKGLHADVTHEAADYGLIVTTSELSPGARSTIAARGYSIEEVDRVGVEKWLHVLRKPGTGIVRV